LTQYRRVTDKRTDRRTDRNVIAIIALGIIHSSWLLHETVDVHVGYAWSSVQCCSSCKPASARDYR